MIAVFGASVTKQKNGYATKLHKYFNHPIKVFGYGGMHLNNAAVCFIDEVIAQNHHIASLICLAQNILK